MKLLKILVPTDFSASSDAALDYAKFIARRFNAAVDLLYVWNAPTGGESAGLTDSGAIRELERRLGASLSDADGRLTGRVEIGELCSTILRVAAADDFDLIVMGLHGGGRVAHVQHGRIALRVASLTTCPVIIIRAPTLQPRSAEVIGSIRPPGAAVPFADSLTGHAEVVHSARRG